MGAAVCQPNSLNPTCAGARSCACNFREEDMPAMLCTREMMPSCMSSVSCMPGRNRCSIHLPEGVAYAEFAFLEARDGRGGLRQTIREGWRRADLTTGSTTFNGPSLFSSRGFIQLCGILPSDLDGIPANMAGEGFCADCSGTTCYWNRGPLRGQMPSVEISIGNYPCSLEIRYYAANQEQPMRVRAYNSLHSTCSSDSSS